MKNKLLGKRIFSIILTIAVILSMMPTMVWADSNEANGIATQASIIKNRSYYTDENGSGETLKVDCVHLTSSITTWEDEWYFVNGGTINGDVTIPEGKTVNIIILDGYKLTINGTLKIAGNDSDFASLKLYGTSKAGTGKIVINNPDSSTNNGNAVMSENGKTAYIHLIGGELTATGSGYNAENGTGAALSNVRLLSEVNETVKRTAKVKCVVTDSDPEQKVEDTQKETSVTISRCECADKDWGIEQGTGENDGKHREYCNLCGRVYNWNAATEGYVDCSFGGGASVSAGGAGHYRTCYCGRQETTVTEHTLVFCPTNDGSGHTQSCGYCGYTSEGSTVEAHVYDENGECTVCGFSIVAKDNNGKFYGSVNDALKSVNDGGTVTLETHDTSGNKEISEAVEFNRAGAAVTLEMNGYTLTSTSGNSTITVENGALTIADDATITQNGGSQEVVKSAIRVTGGTLTFENDVTAQGGACSSAQSPAIEVTGGRLVFKGDLTAKGGYSDGYGNADKQAAAVYAEGGVLDFQKGLDLSGGLTLTKNASLANGLTQGSFWSKAASGPDGKQVKMLSVEGAKNHKYLDELLADGYAFVDKDDSTLFRCVSSFVSWSGDVTIISHTHTWGPADSGDNYECTTCTKACRHDGGFSSGKCEVCGKPCPHALADAANNYHCNECDEQMVARIKYDTYLYHHYPDLKTALEAATDGQTVTLLKDAELLSSPEIYDEAKKDVPHVITLDMNGHNITGEFAVSIGRHVEFVPAPVYAENTEYPTTLKIIGSGDISLYIYALSVYPLATLDLSEWKGDSISMVSTNDGSGENEEGQFIATNYTGHINRLELGYGKKDAITKNKLSRGSYGEIVLLGACGEKFKHGDLLEDGYAFQHTDGTFAEYNAIPEQHKIPNVSVVKCPHEKVAGGTCAYCNRTGIAATVDGVAYESFEAALAAIKDSDSEDIVLRLHNDAEYANTALNSNNLKYKKLTIDLNGYSLNGAEGSSKLIQVIDGAELVIKDSSEDKKGFVDNIQITMGDTTDGNLTLESGTIGTLQASPYSDITLNGGKLGYLTTGTDSQWTFPVAYLLQKGYTLTDKDGNVADLTATSVGNASGSEIYEVKKISGADISGGDKKTETIAYDDSLPFNPAVNLTEEDSAAASVTADWYIKADRKHIASAELTKNDNSYVYSNETFDDDWMTGVDFDKQYDVFCVLTAKDSSGNILWKTPVTGYELTVNKADISKAEITLDNTCTFTPTSQGIGIKQTQNITVKYNGKVLEKDKDYTVSGNTQTNAGEYKLTVTGTGCYTGTKDADWTVSPSVIVGVGISNTSEVVKKYDGTTAAVNPNIEIGTFSYNRKLGETTSVEPINVTADDYEIISAEYASADAGSNKAISYKVKIKNSNYKFENGDTKEFTITEPNFACSIEKADAPAAENGTLTVVNKLKRTYTLDVSKLLPAAPEGEYGKVEYKFGEAKLNDGYYTDGASVDENGMLTIPINKVDSDTAGNIGTVTVTVTTSNYEDITLTVNVNAENKDFPKPDGDITLTSDKLTYGDKLSKITVSGTMKDSLNETVAGSFTWKLPEYVPGAGTYEAEWIFTPDDEDKYLPAEGTAKITVNKADVTGSPEYTAISEKSKTLAYANLDVKDKDGKDKFSVEGTVKWIDKDGNELASDTEVKQGERYKWIFTPKDTANHNILTGEITLWPYPSGGSSADDVKTTTDSATSEKTTSTTVKDTKTETVKNEQGEDISKVTAKVSEKVADKLADEAVSNKSDNVEITVKSKDGNKAEQTEIEIPKKAIDSIAKNSDADLVIKTDNGQIAIDSKALGTIASAAEGDTLRIVVTADMKLRETQKPAADAIGNTGVIFEVAAYIGNTRIYDLKDGKAEILLPVPENLKGKDIAVIHISDKGICEIISHTVEAVEAGSFAKFTTSQFANYAIVEKADADKLIEKQNSDKIKNLVNEVKLKATTSKTSKKNIKVKVGEVKNLSSLTKEAKSMGYTVKYKYYRSVKKSSKYAAKITKKSSSYINTKGKKGTKYYYKARVLVYDGNKLIAQTELKQCSYGARSWSK